MRVSPAWDASAVSASCTFQFLHELVTPSRGLLYIKLYSYGHGSKPRKPFEHRVLPSPKAGKDKSVFTPTSAILGYGSWVESTCNLNEQRLDLLRGGITSSSRPVPRSRFCPTSAISTDFIAKMTSVGSPSDARQDIAMPRWGNDGMIND